MFQAASSLKYPSAKAFLTLGGVLHAFLLCPPPPTLRQRHGSNPIEASRQPPLPGKPLPMCFFCNGTMREISSARKLGAHTTICTVHTESQLWHLPQILRAMSTSRFCNNTIRLLPPSILTCVSGWLFVGIVASNTAEVVVFVGTREYKATKSLELWA